ncbi:MAG: GreA/GreB family elongation factor [Actinomycetota bacterium]|nr:GreA/GreB family elongation factor [Actinomycetota bacterium]
MVTQGQAAEYSSQAGATAVERLEQELVALNTRRRELAEGLSDRDSAGDRADAAGALEQSEDLSWVDERTAQVTEQIGQLRGGTAAGGHDELADGTAVTLRFADGATRTMQAVAITEEIMEGEESTAMTLGSPLARALVGSSAGDTITYRSPSGEKHAEVIAIDTPTSRA